MRAHDRMVDVVTTLLLVTNSRAQQRSPCGRASRFRPPSTARRTARPSSCCLEPITRRDFRAPMEQRIAAKSSSACDMESARAEHSGY
jgi:hypothetical protein